MTHEERSNVKVFYELKLHQVFTTAENSNCHDLFTSVMRVPGGWIYRSFDKGNKIMAAVFVPFNNEFQDGD